MQYKAECIITQPRNIKRNAQLLLVEIRTFKSGNSMWGSASLSACKTTSKQLSTDSVDVVNTREKEQS